MKPLKRVVIINSETQQVTEDEISGLEDMQKIVGGRIERAFIIDNGDEIYVNEEGLLRGSNFFCEMVNKDFILFGNAIIVGAVTPTGANRDALSTTEEIREQINFLGEKEIGYRST